MLGSRRKLQLFKSLPGRGNEIDSKTRVDVETLASIAPEESFGCCVLMSEMGYPILCTPYRLWQ